MIQPFSVPASGNAENAGQIKFQMIAYTLDCDAGGRIGRDPLLDLCNENTAKKYLSKDLSMSIPPFAASASKKTSQASAPRLDMLPDMLH
jgi:hypothetical protein